MNLLLVTLKKILFWSYDRGTWQYDIMCVLILAFIFLSPNSLFKIKNSKLTAITESISIGNPQPVGSVKAPSISSDTGNKPATGPRSSKTGADK